MINFFRKIRHAVLSEGKTTKYFKYAVGEIVLVVLGILIALQVNNWNENRKQDAEFKVTLEQIYNALKLDIDYYKSQTDNYDFFISSIDLLLEDPDSIPLKSLPYKLHQFTFDGLDHQTETAFHGNNLKYNASNKQQNEISKQIIKYANSINFEDASLLKDFQSQLKKINLAYPKVDITRYNQSWITNDSTYYSANDLKNASNLLKSDQFIAVLKTLRTNTFYQKAKTLVRYGDAISLMNIIKKYYPDVKLLFEDVGIKGTAIDGFDNVGGLSTPMTLTDAENIIWEINIYLLQGRIKFRCRDSWSQNWGNIDFPKGVGYHDGPDIPIPEEGNYHVIFKPVTGEYEFIKQDD